MAHLVVVGAGLGGMPAAYELRAALAREHEITLINAAESFRFVPSNTWIAVGWRERAGISFDIRSHLERKGITFLAAEVIGLDPRTRTLELSLGYNLDYDYLILATGPRPAFEAVPGAGPVAGFSHSLCTLEQAERTYQAYQQLLAAPGPIVIGALPNTGCFTPVYEFAFIIDTDLRKRRLRERVPMTFVTPEPYIGHLGMAGVAASRGWFQQQMANRDIRWITNAKVIRVAPGKMLVERYADSGEVVAVEELEYAFSMLMPAFRGVEVVAGVEALCDDRGFVRVDQFQRSRAYPNIFAVGACVAMPVLEDTPVPLDTPKSGFMIESMVRTAVRNLADTLDGREPGATVVWNSLCLTDMGDSGAALVAMPHFPPRELEWFSKGKWVHLAKIAVEKYFLRKVMKGTTEPIYEKYLLKMLGLDSIREARRAKLGT